jgi:DNA ligase-associated metallophosphoesterase
VNITRSGELLTLCPERAIFWPARRTLLIADTHFGKDEVFRRAGVPIPTGLGGHDMTRIATLLEQHQADRLVVLGDLFHGAPELSGDFLVEFGAWIDARPGLHIDIVAGNHDRHGAVGLWSSRVNWHREPIIDGPFALAHNLREFDSLYVFCGHIHPVLRLRSPNGDRARVPVFWFGERRAVLPAFGSFTGGYPVSAEPGDRIFASVDSHILEVTPRNIS